MKRQKMFLKQFIDRPIAAILMTFAILLAGVICYRQLPVAPLPQTDIPTIRVTADYPGASAETMATSVAVPLENVFTGISGINHIVSSSSAGRTTVTLQFDFSQNADAAAQEVQAAINRVSGKLPKDMPALPDWKKVNPADSPVLVLILKSKILPLTELSDLAENVIGRELNQIAGVAELNIIGQQRPAIVVNVYPDKLATLGLTFADVRNLLQKNSVNLAKGLVYGSETTMTLEVNDQLFTPEEYAGLVLADKDGGSVYLRDVADVRDGAENAYVRSWPEGVAGISIEINRQTGANIVQIADEVRAKLPQLRQMLPPSAELSVLNDRTRTIRASLAEVQTTILITLGLVLTVMALFLRRAAPTVIVAVMLAVVLAATVSVMYLLGFSLNNLTLLALVIAIAFVADDAVVVVEHIYNYIESGYAPKEAATAATGEILFTLLAITLSLCAAFIPLFFMGGAAGRLFFEFAATVTVTVVLSLLCCLWLVPVFAAKFIQQDTNCYIKSGKKGITVSYTIILRRCFQYPRRLLMVFLVCTLAAIGGIILLPKGLFPLQDIAYISGSTQAAEDVSFAEMSELHRQLAEIVAGEPAVMVYTHAIGDKNSRSLAAGKFWLVLKDRKDRELSASQLIDKLRGKFAQVKGIKMSLRAAQDMNFGLSQSSAQYLYTLKAKQSSELYPAAEKLTAAMAKNRMFTDVQSDLRLGRRVLKLTVDRGEAARYGLTAEDVDQLLYDAFGQRQVGDYRTEANQYKIVLKLAAPYETSAKSLNYLYLRSSVSGELVPLLSVVKEQKIVAGPQMINRDNMFPAVNISFNLAEGVSLGQALAEIDLLRRSLGIFSSVSGTPQGAAEEFARALQNEGMLIMAALLAIYIILGMLYESFTLPLMIISTIPSAVSGAAVALFLARYDFSVIALIGCIMLIGLVMKNGILMVDTALKLEQEKHFGVKTAIFKAATTRFRPILMTSIAAGLAGIPLIFGQGTGAELRQPLGMVIVGGMAVSQMMTVFTTPVIYFLIRKRNKEPF